MGQGYHTLDQEAVYVGKQVIGVKVVGRDGNVHGVDRQKQEHQHGFPAQ